MNFRDLNELNRDSYEEELALERFKSTKKLEKTLFWIFGIFFLKKIPNYCVNITSARKLNFGQN